MLKRYENVPTTACVSTDNDSIIKDDPNIADAVNDSCDIFERATTYYYAPLWLEQNLNQV